MCWLILGTLHRFRSFPITHSTNIGVDSVAGGDPEQLLNKTSVWTQMMTLLYLWRDFRRLPDSLPEDGHRRAGAVVVVEEPLHANPACQPHVSVL